MTILSDSGRKDEMLELLYTETTTLGVRINEVERDCLARTLHRIGTRFGEIDVKVAKYKEQVVSAKPEYDQLREFAASACQPLLVIEAEVAEDIRRFLAENEF
ncbi:MAG: DUF111 family protein [Acidobacteria bacterium]|nr:DUF111 family protein [Acidobacteriota bacterium]